MGNKFPKIRANKIKFSKFIKECLLFLITENAILSYIPHNTYTQNFHLVFYYFKIHHITSLNFSPKIFFFYSIDFFSAIWKVISHLSVMHNIVPYYTVCSNKLTFKYWERKKKQQIKYKRNIVFLSKIIDRDVVKSENDKECLLKVK